MRISIKMTVRKKDKGKIYCVTERLLYICNRIVTNNMRRDVFQAIADPVRREIIEVLSRESLTMNEVADQFEISRPAISKHVRILKECGIVEIEQKGRARFCKIQPENLIPAFMWIDQYRHLWEERLDNFESYLMELKNKQNK